MKIKFTKECMDKHTHERYHVDDVKEFSDERANEIVGVGFAICIVDEQVEVVEEEATKDVAQEATNDEPLRLSEMTKAQLVELAKEHGVSTRGNKEAIIQRLLQLQ